MAEFRLETERLELREPQQRDLAWQLEWLNTVSVMRHLGGEVRPAEKVAQGFDRNLDAWKRRQPTFWTVVHRESGEPIGKCGLSRIEEAPAPAAIRGAIQVGWSLAEPFWNQGYASEAASAALTHGFAAFGVDEIWSQTSDANLASTRLMARLGLVRCSDLSYFDPDYPPVDNPTIVYRLGRKEWAARA